MVTLSTLDFVNGLFSLLVITIAAIIGISIASKYIKYKAKIYLYWGIAYIGVYCPWWPSGISFLSVLITGQPISNFMYVLIGNIFIPFFLILWLFGLTEMIFQDKRKILLIIYSIILAVAEIYLIYALMTDINLIVMEFTGIFDVRFNRIWLAYLLMVNFTAAITGLLFARDSLKSDDREVRFKGKCLIIAFLTYPICGVIDGGVQLNAIGLIVIRSLLMLGAVMFYIGFFVPKFIKKLFKLE
jgi:hypothetical protein